MKNIFDIFKNKSKVCKVIGPTSAITDCEVEEIRADQEMDLKIINKEFDDGFEMIKRYPKSVSIFGSARTSSEDHYYKVARELGGRIVRELGYAVVTGGGPGVMEGANRGAFESGGPSVGLSIVLPREQDSNPYLTDEMIFNYFFSRKTILTFAAEAYVFFPGGFGTMDELFDIMTLVQTHKIPRVPIILYGVEFWRPLDHFIKEQMLEKEGAIDEKDTRLYDITNDQNEIINIIKRTPVKNWWKNFERN